MRSVPGEGAKAAICERGRNSYLGVTDGAPGTHGRRPPEEPVSPRVAFAIVRPHAESVSSAAAFLLGALGRQIAEMANRALQLRKLADDGTAVCAWEMQIRAQMERYIRIVEVGGSIPPRSIFSPHPGAFRAQFERYS